MCTSGQYFILLGVISAARCVVYLNTKIGRIRGIRMTSRDGRKFNAFLGIPFAKPPIGELRFEDPQPITERWNYTLDVTAYTERCPQLHGPGGYSGDEDCLYLNVYTPVLPDDITITLPVWVWIFPGKRMFGDPHPYHYGPQYIMDKRVVFVAPSYRLNILGFLSTGDDACAGNFGLKDQTMALRWVQENIIDFRGDPSNVTLTGESSSAADVNFHLFSPLSKGLFHRAIAQSGSALNYRTMLDAEKSRRRAWAVGGIVGCKSKYIRNSQDLVECLRSVPIQFLLKSLYRLMHDYILPYNIFGPVIEPRGTPGAFLTSDPTQEYENARSPVPLLLGVNGDEGAPKMLTIFGKKKIRDHFFSDYERLFPPLFGYDHRSDANKITKILLDHYVGNKSLHEAFGSLSRLAGFAAVTLSVMEAAVHHKGITYLYVYNHTHEVGYFRGFEMMFEMYVKEKVGAVHGEELRNIFYIPLFFPAIVDGVDREVSDRMLTLWFNFVKYGNPNGESGDEIWKPVSSSDIEYLFINTTHCAMRSRYLWDEYTLWNRIGCPTLRKSNKTQ